MVNEHVPSRLEVVVGNLGVHQDFFWFAVLLSWSFALIAWWRTPRSGTGWAWLPWAAGAGAASAFVAFCVFNPPLNLFYERLVPGTSSNYVPALINPNVFGDVALGAIFAALAAGWAWHGLVGVPRAVRWLLVAVALALSVGQALEPRSGGWLLTVAAIGAAVLYAVRRRRGTSLFSRAALGVAATVPLLSTVGPLAWAAGAEQRSGPPTPFGAFFAAAQIGAALVAIVGLVAESRRYRRERGIAVVPWPESRILIVGGVLWICAGVVFAIVTGRSEKLEVKTNRLRTAAARAATFDPAVTAAIANAEARRGGLDPQLSHQLHLTLAEMLRSTPFLTAARILVIREGWIEVLAAAPKPVTAPVRLRPATADDVAHWREATPYNEYSPVPEQGAPYYCRAPLRDAAGRTVAWLEFVREEFYSSMDRKWRTAPLLVTALGLIIATFVALQRAAARERMAAQNAASVAAEANRMKTAFLAKVSHELRTPLQSILGYCELLALDADPAKRAARLAALRQHSELMLRLVNDLLDLSTIESGAFRFTDRPVALADLVSQTVDSLRPRADAKGLALNCRIDPAVPPWLETDPERWRQIVLNLVGNAIKFTATGGVRVELGVLERDAGRAAIELAVTDTGPGIPLQDQTRLFQSFSRLELTAQHEGVGLGLALVAALCRGAGGDVSVTSDGRNGSCFRVRLPLRTTRAPAGDAGVAPTTPLNGHRVLVADDNALVRELFADHLAACGAVCDTVADGSTAVSAIESGGYDALIVDLAMPGLDGFQVTRRLRETGGRGLRIVGVSAHAGELERRRALEAGMDAFLAKPVPLGALAAALGARSASGFAVDGGDGLAGRMQQLFRNEAPREIEALAAARGREDWAAVRSRVHWLRNSAVVLGQEELARKLGGLERLAESRDAAAFDAAWPTAREALEAML